MKERRDEWVNERSVNNRGEMGKGEMDRASGLMGKDEGDLSGGGEKKDHYVDIIIDDDEEGSLEHTKWRALVRCGGQGEDGGSCKDGTERDGDGDGMDSTKRQGTVSDRGRGGTIDDEEQNESLQRRAARMKAQSIKLLDEGEVTFLVSADRGREV